TRCLPREPAVTPYSWHITASKRQHAIAAAESEGKAQRPLDRAIRVLVTDLRTTDRIEHLRIERAGQQSMLQREQGDPGFDDPRGAQRMAGPAFRGARDGVGGKQIC